MISLASLLRTTSPVIAIPIEGSDPFCVEGKRLRTWAKGIGRHTVKILTFWYYEEKCVDYGHEGPADMVAIYSRVLHIRHDKGWAKFLPMKRGETLWLTRKWSDRERERLQKKSITGALTAAQRKALKAAKYNDDAEGMISLMVAGKHSSDPKTRRMGVPVEIPEFPLLSFAVVRFGTVNDENVTFSVTETITGAACGFGATAERALLDARQKASKLSPERRAQVTANCHQGVAA